MKYRGKHYTKKEWDRIFDLMQYAFNIYLDTQEGRLSDPQSGEEAVVALLNYDSYLVHMVVGRANQFLRLQTDTDEICEQKAKYIYELLLEGKLENELYGMEKFREFLDRDPKRMERIANECEKEFCKKYGLNEDEL